MAIICRKYVNGDKQSDYLPKMILQLEYTHYSCFLSGRCHHACTVQQWCHHLTPCVKANVEQFACSG